MVSLGDEESARRSARELSIALRQEEEESSQDERDIEWPEDIFEYVSLVFVVETLDYGF